MSNILYEQHNYAVLFACARGTLRFLTFGVKIVVGVTCRLTGREHVHFSQVTPDCDLKTKHTLLSYCVTVCEKTSHSDTLRDTCRQSMKASVPLIRNVLVFLHNTVIRRLSCYHIGSYE